MDLTDYGAAAMRRGSYDDAAASMHPTFGSEAALCSVPGLWEGSWDAMVSYQTFNLSKPSSSGGCAETPTVVGDFFKAKETNVRHNPPSQDQPVSAQTFDIMEGDGLWVLVSLWEEAPCWVSVEQSPFVLGLTSENGELLLDECAQVTEGTKTKEQHLFLFTDVLIFAKLKSTASYRLKQRVNLEDVWLCDFEEEEEEEDDDSGTAGDVDPRLTLVLAWALTFCLVCFRSPEVKERWSDTLHRKIRDAKARTGCASSSPPDVLMKVLSGSIATKTLTGGGMEQMIVLTPEGDAKSCALSKQLNNQEERLTQSSETKWNLVRNRMKLRRTSSKACHANKGTKNQLFGQPLSNICPDDYSLPKPITDLLLLLKKRGPSAEGVFRKPCNTRLMKDLREQLDNGTDVDLEGQQVHLLVGLLKCFLKELPHSLLRSDLYNRWTAALDHEDTAQRSLEIRKVLDDLPGPNKLLLQYLVCLFHCILESSDINKMDASNLAVCIGPTLLQLDGTPLDGQREKMQKATELTQFLIENYMILGENIPCLLDTDEDSLSSVHHDSAYDSTDPDGDGEAGEKRSSTDGGRGSSSSYSSLSPSITTSSWQSDAAFDSKAPFNRRCSEPILLLPENLENLRSHARSHDDFSMQRDDFDGQPLKKQISDDSFLLKSRGGARSVLSFPKLSCSSNMDLLPYMGKDCSCSSLESTASNQSESSVFTSSPMGSPRCSKKDNRQPLVTTNGKLDIPRPISEEKRRSQSMRVASKVLMRTRSLGAFSRNSLKKDAQKENSFPETLQEDSHSEADPSADVLLKSRPLSAIEVFKQVDSKLPSSPPSYEQAVQNMAPPPLYGSMTVQDAVTQIRRSRPSSMNYDLPVNHDCFSQTVQDTVVERRQLFRQRAMSESVSKGQHETVSRRCSQPVFEEFSYAKESYV